MFCLPCVFILFSTDLPVILQCLGPLNAMSSKQGSLRAHQGRDRVRYGPRCGRTPGSLRGSLRAHLGSRSGSQRASLRASLRAHTRFTTGFATGAPRAKMATVPLRPLYPEEQPLPPSFLARTARTGSRLLHLFPPEQPTLPILRPVSCGMVQMVIKS